MKRTNAWQTAIGILVAGLLLTGCAGTAPDSGAGSGTPTETTAPEQAPTPSTAPTATTPSCGTLTSQQALDQWLGEVPPFQPGSGESWAYIADPASPDGYDPCVALSWIVLAVEDGTVSSPYQIMLFHYGEYLGTTASDGYGFHPDIERLDAGAIQVTYRWLQPGESNAEASGRSVSVFTWDEASQSVVHTGDFPPTG